MKRPLLLYFILLLPFQLCAQVQRKSNCDTIIAQFNQFYNYGDFASALPLWRDAYKNCPAASKSIYTNGAVIYEKLVAAEMTSSLRLAFADSLLLIYDQQMKYFKDNGVTIGKKGLVMYRFIPSRINEAVKLMNASVTGMGNGTEPDVLFYYFQGNSQLYNSRQITSDSLAEIFYLVSMIYDSNRGNPRYDEFSKKTNSLFSVLFPCAMIEKIYGSKLQTSPDSTELLQRVVQLSYKGKCTSSQLYETSAQKLFRKGPTPLTARSLAQLNAAKGEQEKAAGYYNDAMELESDPVKKALLLMDAAEFQRQEIKSFPQARSLALRAAAYNAAWGKPWLFIGDLYFESAGDCEKEMKNVPAYWAAADKYLEAKTVEPSIAEIVDPKIKICEGFFPEIKDLSTMKLQPGDTWKVKCWIGENTIIRSRK